MINTINIFKKVLLLSICIAITINSTAQLYACVFKDTLFNIDFGSAVKAQFFNLNMLKEYRLDNTTCPPDNYYAFASHTNDCFNNEWHTLPEDHTPGDDEGKMMLVNSSAKPGLFFVTILNGFRPNTNYEMGVWMMNLCKLHTPCNPIPPDISIALETADGKRLIDFNTGILSQNDFAQWKRYYGFFTIPADVTSLTLKMVNFTPGGCGDDFAMDDITVRECYPPPAPVKETPGRIKKTEPQIAKINAPQKTPEKPGLKKNNNGFTQKKDSLKKTLPISIKPFNIPIPERIKTRDNPVVKEIEIAAGEVLIELYDNGIVDGDTVSIYHNNELIKSRARISEKAVTVHITVDAGHPHHEIVMVADNLGSIPPNTSLMIVTAKGFRKEIFISSTEQKNAKVIIDLKEQE